VIPISIRVQRLGKVVATAAILALAACSNDLVREEYLPDKGYLLSIDAYKGCAVADTRALIQEAGETGSIKAVWGESDRVTVLSSEGSQLGTMAPVSIGSASTKLKATLHTPVKKGDQLTLVFPRVQRDYTGQKGTLADIAANYDYATASVTVNYADDSFVSATDAHFTNQQAIVMFKLTNGTNPLRVSSLTIAADGLIQKDKTAGPVTINPESESDVIYAALSGLNGNVTLTAIAGNKTFSATSPHTHDFKNSKYYYFTVDMQKPPESYPEPLTLECFDRSGCYVTVSNAPNGLQYTTDGGTTWINYSKRIYLDIIGKKVSFRGTGTQTTATNYMNIKCDGDCYIYGNIMSLLSNDFATLRELPYSNTFQNLFMDNRHITHMEGKDLVLPATKLKNNCYYQMFKGCTNLNYVKCLATDISANNCTTNWLQSVAKKGTFVRAEGVSWPIDSNNGIPYGWKDVIEE